MSELRLGNVALLLMGLAIVFFFVQDEWAAFIPILGLLALIVGSAAVLPPLMRKSVRRKWADWFLRAVQRPWQALATLAAIALSVASGYTTWVGLTEHTGAWTLSLLLAFGLQLLLLLLALHIGQVFVTELSAPAHLGAAVASSRDEAFLRRRFAKRRRAGKIGVLIAVALAVSALFFAEYRISALEVLGVLVLIVVVSIIIVARHHVWAAVSFLVVMAISVFFSFDALYSFASPPSERELIAQKIARDDIEDLLARLRRDVGERRLEFHDQVRDGAEWQEFRGRLEAVADAAIRFGQIVAVRRSVEQSQSQSTLEALQNRLAIDQRSLNRLRVEQETLATAISDAEQEIVNLAPRLAELARRVEEAEKAVREKEAEVRAEKSGITDFRGSGTAGEGPLYFAKINELETSKIGLEVARKEFSSVDNKRADLEARALETKKRLADVSTQTALLEEKVREGKLKIAEAEEKIRSIATLGPIGDHQSIEQFKLGWTEFENSPSEARLNGLVSACNNFLTAMMGIPQLRPEADKLDCNQGAFASAATRYFAYVTTAANFEAECNEQRLRQAAQPLVAANPGPVGSFGFAAPADPGSTPDSTRLVFSRLTDYGRGCVAVSGLPPELQQRHKHAINRLEQEIDPRADNRIGANLASFERGDKTALLWGIIALAMDGLVFVTGLLGARAAVRPIARPAGETAEDKIKRIEQRLRNPKIDGNEPDGIFIRKLFLQYLQFDPDIGAQYCGVIELNKVAEPDRIHVHRVLSLKDYCHPDEKREGRHLILGSFVDHINEDIAEWEERLALQGENADQKRPNLASRWIAEHPAMGAAGTIGKDRRPPPLSVHDNEKDTDPPRRITQI